MPVIKLKLFCAFLFFSTAAFAQFPTDGYRLDNPYFLDSTVADYDVFLTAEMHWRKENSNRKKRMIEYLASKNSLDIIVAERTYAFGHWVNYFLETGDSLFLKEYLNLNNFFSTREGVVYEDEYAFYCWLRKFNLEHNLSIKVVGIDLFPFHNGKYNLWSFVKFTEQNSRLQDPLKSSLKKAKQLLNRTNVSTGAMLRWYRKLEPLTNKMKIEDEDFLNYLHNLKQSIPWARKNDLDYRDGQIAENFKRYIEEGHKVYGQYGLTHIALKNDERTGWNTFASVLNRDQYYRGKILSVGLVCFGCDTFNDFPGPDLFRHFVTQQEFDRLKPEFLALPPNTFVDLRSTDEKIKDYCQLLLVEFD